MSNFSFWICSPRNKSHDHARMWEELYWNLTFFDYESIVRRTSCRRPCTYLQVGTVSISLYEVAISRASWLSTSQQPPPHPLQLNDENIYYQKVLQIYVTSWLLTKLLGSIYHGRDDIMASAIEHGRVPSHQGHWDSTEELACWLSLVTALESVSFKKGGRSKEFATHKSELLKKSAPTSASIQNA